MEDEIKEIYEKISDQISEEDFLEKMKFYREENKDISFYGDKDFANMVLGEYKTENVEHISEQEEYKKEKINELTSGLQGIELIGKVMMIGSPKTFQRKGKPGRVCNIEIADDTGSIRVTLWSENIKLLKNINEGEIVKITDVDIKDGFRGGLEATCRPRSLITHAKGDFSNFPNYEEKLMTIEEINNIEKPGNDTKVNLIARIIRIPNVRSYEKNGKEGQVASLELQDATGQISYTLWNKSTDLIKVLELDDGDTVKILNAQVRERNGEFSLSHWDGRIIKGDYNVPEFENTFINIAEVKDKQKNISIIGIITKIHDTITFERKDGSEGCVKSIEIEDDTGSIKVTLWNDDTKMDFKKGDVLQVVGGDVNFDEYTSSGYSVNTTWNSSFKINPEINEELQEFFNQCKERMGPISIGQLQEYDDEGEEVDVIGRMISVGDIVEFTREDGSVGIVRSADFSDGEGIVQLSFWDKKAQKEYEVGAPYSIENARTKMGMYSVDLNIGASSRVFKLTEKQAKYLPSFETIQKSVYDYKMITDVDEDDTNIIVVGLVIDAFDIREFERDDGSKGYVRNIEIADNSGIIRVTLWDKEAKKNINVGDKIKIQNPSVRFNENRVELSISRNTSILEPSENESNELPSIDELQDKIYQSKTISELEDDDINVKIIGALHDLNPERVLLFKCPNCNSTINNSLGEEFICDFCGEVVDSPKILLMIPGRLEDENGDTIPVTFFGNIAEQIIDMNLDEIVEIIGDTGDYGALEGKIENLEGLTLEIIADVSWDEYNEEIRLRPKKLLSKYY